ncbi:MAG: tryptophan--tRNA ligase [Betaproteobacteria bacterium]
MKSLRVLTGITTSGTPHLGNYVGAIRPSVQASLRPEVQSFYFLADYHALIKVGEPERIQQSTLEIAATWLATGLDPEKVTFYRQSDIPEIPELTWFLTCMAGKGLLNRAHAYKAQLDKNLAAGAEPDHDVSAGLFMYPVLMAADILMFKAHQVPVGRDQIQHIEMARDMAASFNHLYGPHLVLPEAAIEEQVATLPGLDGRKMSKSYDNTIALFGPTQTLRKQIASMVTDSRKPGEPKATEGSALFEIYRAFATAEETRALAQAYAHGIAWADAKQMLYERIEREVAPMRESYERLMADPGRIEDILRAGADKARRLSTPFMHELRQAVGLRRLGQSLKPAQAQTGGPKALLPGLKQYREEGKFYFKLVDGQGQLLLQSRAFDSPRPAGELVARLKQGDDSVLLEYAECLEPVSAPQALALALQALREAAEAGPT